MKTKWMPLEVAVALGFYGNLAFADEIEIDPAERGSSISMTIRYAWWKHHERVDLQPRFDDVRDVWARLLRPLISNETVKLVAQPIIGDGRSQRSSEGSQPVASIEVLDTVLTDGPHDKGLQLAPASGLAVGRYFQSVHVQRASILKALDVHVPKNTAKLLTKRGRPLAYPWPECEKAFAAARQPGWRLKDGESFVQDWMMKHNNGVAPGEYQTRQNARKYLTS